MKNQVDGLKANGNPSSNFFKIVVSLAEEHARNIGTVTAIKGELEIV